MQPDDTLNELVRCVGILRRAKARSSGFKIAVWVVLFDKKKKAKKGRLSLHVAGKDYGYKKIRAIPFIPILLKRIVAEIPYSDIENSGIHNIISVVYKDKNDKGFVKPILYSLRKSFRGMGKNKALITFDETNTTMYIRQSVNNWAHITQRRRNKSDDKRLNKLITIAYYLSFLFRFRKLILLYEKESEKFEESASIVFERLIDSGYKNVYFILDPLSTHSKFVPEPYGKYVIPKHTLKHYLYFFAARTFLGTEMPSHAIDLRVANKHAVRKIYSPKINFVFLQHGVMYFVALSSKARSAARKGTGIVPKQAKIVVSSELEAKHFVEHGGYNYEDLYLTGLPKLDKSFKNDNASKIVIMPTWRPWEYNQVRVSPEESPYYKMLVEIIDSVPDDLKNNIQLLPHPLFIREIKNSVLSKYIKDFNSYDEVLQQTDILITDYSSVSADAFYRGSKVIFWWKEKDYCMEQYGGELMLNKGNVFGDIVMNSSELKKSIQNNYKKNQSDLYSKRFSRIVEFHDGKNTDRLTKKLKEDSLI